MSYFCLKNPRGFIVELLFHKVPWVVASESASANKTMFKVGDKKESRTVSVNVNRVSL